MQYSKKEKVMIKMFTEFDKALRKLPDGFKAPVLGFRTPVQRGKSDKHVLSRRKNVQVPLLATVCSNQWGSWIHPVVYFHFIKRAAVHNTNINKNTFIAKLKVNGPRVRLI